MSFFSNLIPREPKRLIATTGFVAVAVSLAFAVPQIVSSRNLQRERVATERMGERGIQLGAADALEVRRTQYLRVLINLHQASEIYGAGSLPNGDLPFMDAKSTAERTMDMVNNLSDAELTMMIEFVPDLTPLLNATQQLVQVALSDQMNSTGGPGYSPQNGGTVNSSGFPDAPYSTEVGSTRPTTGALLAAAAVFEVADDVRELAGRACDEVIVAIGAGGNGALFCLISDGVWVVAKSVFWGIQFESDDVDSAEILGTYLRSAHLHTDIEGVQSSLNTHDANIDGDLAAHNANIDADLVAHNANIDADLVAHNANIDADLVAHDANIDQDLIDHDVNITALLGTAQATLDNEIEKRQVHLQVFQISDRKFMLVSTESGLSVNVAINSVEVFIDSTNSFIPVPGSTITNVDTGTYVIEVILPVFGQAKILRIKATHDDIVDHYGEIIFTRD